MKGRMVLPLPLHLITMVIRLICMGLSIFLNRTMLFSISKAFYKKVQYYYA